MLKGGTQVHLKWNYIKPSSWHLQQTVFSLYGGDIGILHHSTGQTEIFDRYNYRTRFAISQSEVATLILKNVTKSDEGIFRCKLVMSNVVHHYSYFGYEIYVKPAGKFTVMFDGMQRSKE